MRRIYLGLSIIFIVLALLSIDVPTTVAQAGDPWSLIAEVNALRASYDLLPYEVNNALMAIAQSHSEYMLSAGGVTHAGPDGSRPYDRAVAAGYGGSAQLYVSENVAMGVNLSPQQTVYEIWQDSQHLETMISTLYTEIGAGMAISGDYVYYTIVVGTVAGSSGSSASPSSGNQNSPAEVAPTVAIIMLVEPATTAADGSIVHVVAEGQALWHIAEAYEIPMPDLLALNNLTESSIIYPGDKLVIQAANQTLTPTPEAAQEQQFTQTPGPTRTREPTPTATPTRRPPTSTPAAVTATQSALTLAATPRSTAAPANSTIAPASNRPASGPDYLLLAIGGLGLGGLALVLFGGALKRTSAN
jgi:LysM repeat protein